MSIFIKENLSSLGICKLSCETADDKDDDIFKPKRRFPDVNRFRELRVCTER